MKNINCVQCGEEMKKSYGLTDNFSAPFCENTKCPNYALLQVGVVIPEKEEK